MSYEVIITVTFQYTFSTNETNQIVIVLAEMYRDISKCPDQVSAELFKATVDYDHQSTIINASIAPCNASVEQNNLSEQVLVDNIKDQTNGAIDINPNRTSIDLHEIYKDLQPQSSSNREQLFQSDIVLWMVRIIGAQLALCCVLSCCVYFLRRRTRRLSEAKDEIIRAVRERKRGDTDTINLKTDSSPRADSSVMEYNVDPHQMLMYPNNNSLTGSSGMDRVAMVMDEEVTTPSSQSGDVPFDDDGDHIDSEMMMLHNRNQNSGIWSHLKRGFANQRDRRRRVHTIISDRSFPSIPHDTPRREGRKSVSTNLRETQPLALGMTGSPTLLSNLLCLQWSVSTQIVYCADLLNIEPSPGRDISNNVRPDACKPMEDMTWRRLCIILSLFSFNL